MVLVHDAARPFTSSELISSVIEQTRQHEACVPVLPVRDTLKEVSDGRIVRTLDRKGLNLVQTPQGFEINLLKRAFQQAIQDGFYGTDEATLVERLGFPGSCGGWRELPTSKSPVRRICELGNEARFSGGDRLRLPLL